MRAHRRTNLYIHVRVHMHLDRGMHLHIHVKMREDEKMNIYIYIYICKYLNRCYWQLDTDIAAACIYMHIDIYM